MIAGRRPLQVVDDAPAAAADNMAIDEALLAGERAAVLRLYGWAPAAVSIGRFQCIADFADDDFGPIVRRVTGGGAIHHDHELTFALIGGRDALPAGIDASYELIHGAIGQALGRFGVVAQRCGRGAASPRPSERWCFERPTCHDLVTATGKIVGSAQRRTGGGRARILHHGSIVLTPPAATPGCGAVAEFVDPDSISTELRREIATQIARALEREPVAAASDLAPAQLDRARAVVRARLWAR